MRFFTSFLAAAVFVSLCVTLSAQDLPRGFAPEELQLMGTYQAPKPPASNYTTPPTSPVRAMAEWEELQGLATAWNYGSSLGRRTILTEIIRAAREECNVIVCCSSQSNINSAASYLVSQGVDTSSNVTFIVAPTNTIWMRDYGPNCVYTNDVDSLLIIDWIYNRPRPQDDAIPTTIGNLLGLPVYSNTQAPYDLVHTGGNFMSDGFETGFSSKLIFRNNDQTSNGECGWDNDLWGSSNHDEAAIDNIMADFMGIQRFAKLEELPYDCIHHIDMHIKLLDEETLLVGEYPAGIADGPQIEANLQYILNNFNSVYGTPYKVVRIPMPPESGAYPDQGAPYRTYVNSVFVNKTVLLPLYETQYDTTALRIWRETLPGYNIVGIDCNALISSDGAIHCITHEIGVNDPLRIVHQPLSDQVYNFTTPPFPVHALIQHREGIANATLWYTTDTSAGGNWTPLNMSPYNPIDTANIWTAAIPVPSNETDIFYYIEANANNGRNAVRPLPAPKGWWKFHCFIDISATNEPESVAMQAIYPNPANAITCIPVTAKHSTQANISLLNAYGQVVETIHSGNIPQGTSKYFINAANFPAGLYYVRISTGNAVVEQKLAIVR